MGRVIFCEVIFIQPEKDPYLLRPPTACLLEDVGEEFWLKGRWIHGGIDVPTVDMPD